MAGRDATSPSRLPRMSPRALVVLLLGQAAIVVALVLLLTGGSGGGDQADRPPPRATPAVPADGGASAARRRVNRFDAGRAMRLVRMQVRYGQRPAGSPALRRLAVRLRGLLPRGRFEPVPGHEGLRNVVGRLPGTRPAILLGAHYDTEVQPEGFVGANDGAAGTAAVLEVARALRGVRRPAGAPEIRFVLFDGEEEPRPTDDFYRDALRGSKAYAAQHAGEVRAMFLLDYIAHKGLRLPREATSDVQLWTRVRRAAQRVGAGSFFPDAINGSITDDHTPFLRAGVPAVDFIDFSYRYRDTVEDTVDKLSQRSIDAVGETVVEVLRTMR